MTRSRPPSAGTTPGRWTALGALLLLVLLLLPTSAQAQVRDRDARIPRAGEVWIEVAPQFTSWNRQFALGSAEVSDGQKEPVYAHYDGSVADRLFPGLDPLLAVVNRDAAALGFDPLTASELDMGAVDFGSIDVFVRSIPLGLQLGIGGFASVEILAPIVKAEVETGFTFDSATAALVRAETALADPVTFLSQLDAAQSQLRTLIDGGTLTAQDSAAAEQLLSDTEAFQGALDARITGQEYLFTSASASGQQITAYYAGFETGFQTFGISVPAFALTDTAVRSDLNAYFERDPVLGQPLGKVTRGYSIGEIDVGLRFKILDNFGWPSRPPETDAAADSVAAMPDAGAPIDSLAPPADSAQAVVQEPEETSGIRYRTTAGVRYRFSLSNPDEEPFLVPGVFLQQPIGDGQPDVQLELYQDLAFGTRFWVVAGAEYGIQLQDEMVRRVAPADRPYAYASQEVTVARDLGDYFRFVLSPRFALAEALSLAVEYTFWNKGDDSYETVDGGVDAAPLTLETSETRHTLGIGAYYRTSRLFAAGRSGIPVDLAFVWETAISGSGGQTPAGSVVTASARIPFKLF